MKQRALKRKSLMGCTQKLCAVRAMRNTMNQLMGRRIRMYAMHAHIQSKRYL